MKIKSTVNWFVSRLWVLVVVVVVLIAVYVALGRQAVSLLPQYRPFVESFLSEKLKVPVEIESLAGEWNLFSPGFIAKGVVINPKYSKSLRLPKLDSAYVEVDVLASLLNFEPRFGRILVDGLRIGVQRDTKGKLSVLGLPFLKRNGAKKDDNKKSKMTVGNRIDLMLEQRNVLFTNVLIDYFELGRNVTLLAEELRIGKRGDFYELQALLSIQRETTVRLEMTAVFEGKPDDLETLKGEAYLKVLEGNFASWLPQQKYKGIQIDNVDLSTELWAEFSDGKLLSLEGSAEAKNVTGVGVDENPITTLDKLAVSFVWRREVAVRGDARVRVADVNPKSSKWMLAIHRLDLDYGQYRWRNRKIYIASNRQAMVDGAVRNVLDAQVNEFSIQPLVDLLLSTRILTPERRSLIVNVAPEGVLKNTSVKLVLLDNEVDSMRLQSEFNSVKLVANGKIPGFENLSGYIDTTLNDGVIHVDAIDPVLNLSALMREPIVGAFIRGPLRWTKNEDGVHIETGVITTKTADARAEVMASLQLYSDKTPPFLQLHAGIFDGDAAQTSTYLPAKKIKKSLLKWLDDGIVGGELIQGDILYNGPVKIDQKFQARRTIQMRFQLEKAEVDYFTGWPKITEGTADIIVRAKDVEVFVSDGLLMGAKINDAFIGIPYQKDNWKPRLLISGDISGDLSEGLDFLRESPLHKPLSGFIEDLSGKGDMNVKLDLGFPLGKSDEPMKTDVWVDVKNSELRMESVDLDIFNVEGSLTYDADNGLNSDRLEGRLFKRSVVASIKSTLENREFVKVDITVDGDVAFSDLNDWAKQPILTMFDGETAYQSVLHFWSDGQNKRNTIDVTSGLKGIKIDMPPPIYKTEYYSKPATYSMTLGGGVHEQLEIRVQYDDDLNMAIGIDDLGIERGKLSFSKNKAVMPRHSGVVVDGSLEYLDVDEWMTFFGDISDLYSDSDTGDNNHSEVSVGKEGRSVIDTFRLADLHVDKMNVFGEVLEDVNGQVVNSGDLWLVRVQNEMLSALFRVPSIYIEIDNYEELTENREFPSDVIDADFIYVRLPAEDEVLHSEFVGPFSYNLDDDDIDPQQFPPFTLRVQELKLGDDDWGQWNAQATLTENGLVFRDATAEFKQIKMSGDAVWEWRSDGVFTEFVGTATSNNVAQLMQDFGTEPAIASSEMKMNFSLEWPGAPIDFDMSICAGEMDLKVRDGQLLSVDDAANSIRVLGLLNFETLGRRLKLDFGDLYKKGLAFDYLGGKFSIKDAIVKSDNFKLEGPSTQLEMKGTVNVDTHELKQDIKVTLPVGRNLVLPAAMVGGLPLAATIYVVDKAIGSQLNKLTTFRFEMTGDWDDPQMSEVKLF